MWSRLVTMRGSVTAKNSMSFCEGAILKKISRIFSIDLDRKILPVRFFRSVHIRKRRFALSLVNSTFRSHADQTRKDYVLSETLAFLIFFLGTSNFQRGTCSIPRTT